MSEPAQEFITHKFWIGRSPPVVICRRDRNGCFVINCRSPLSCPQPLSIFLVSIASLPFSIFPLFSSTRSDGRVAEWSNVPDSKSGEAFSFRGFESHPFRWLLWLISEWLHFGEITATRKVTNDQHSYSTVKTSKKLEKKGKSVLEMTSSKQRQHPPNQ